MSKWSKETQSKIDECVLNICNLIDENIYKNSSFHIHQQIKDNVDEFANWFHNKTCNDMIDPD